MDCNNEDKFLLTELREREQLNKLFHNYFQKRNCKNLQLTEPNSFISYDAKFLSGSTNAIAEYKNRSISIRKFHSCIIEYPKYKYLFDHFKESFIPLYIVSYSDCIAIWDLTPNILFELDHNLQPDYYFTVSNCVQNNFSNTKKEKLIRYLRFEDATILTKDYQQISYLTLLQNLFYQDSFSPPDEYL